MMLTSRAREKRLRGLTRLEQEVLGLFEGNPTICIDTIVDKLDTAYGRVRVAVKTLKRRGLV